LSGAVAFLGFAIGWWLVPIGMVAILFSTIGFVFEYYRGHFSH
jgi:cytochrome c oxidase subunit IV